MKKGILIFLLFLAAHFSLSATAIIQGHILTPNGLPVANVAVGPTVTDANGFYTYEVASGATTTIAPSFYQAAHIGVDLNDRLLLENHVLGLQPIDDTYQLLAADVGGSDGLTTFDIVLINHVITGLATTYFPDDVTWRFYPADYDFPDPQDPFGEDVPEAVNIANAEEGLTYTIDFVAIKMGDIDGSLIPGDYGRITGAIFQDDNGNCTEDGSETGLQGWLLKFSGAHTFYANTNESGVYSIGIPVGNYTVEAIEPFDYWENCAGPVSVEVTNMGTVTQDFPQTPEVSCPLLEVDLTVDRLRRCFQNFYVVSYRNIGTATATDASVDVTLDDFLSLTFSEIPPAAVAGNTYTFNLGDLAPQAGGNLYLEVLVSCEAELGQTHCSTAHIYPDSICKPDSPLWDGSSLQVSGDCDTETVQFKIENKGADMTAPAGYIVIEDDLIMYTGEILLTSNASEMVEMPANGSTFRIEVEQADGHPGNSHPSLSIEACGANAGGGVSTGFVNAFPQDENNPFISIDCTENIGSFDPNDKQGFPRGVSEDHYIKANTDLEYLIRFQNTGTDTAIHVIIKDTLAAGQLEPTSVRPGASSHPYRFTLTDEGVLNFYFEQIMLPDSNVNEPASHGFVKFRIRQQPDLPLQTRIENRAAIYFDFNEPVLTNTTFHTIGTDFIPTGIQSPDRNLTAVRVTLAPNPAAEVALLTIEDTEVQGGYWWLYSPTGQVMRQAAFRGHQFALPVKGLPKGLYYYHLQTEDGQMATGKVMVGR